MKVTVDNVKVKRGDIVFEIGIDINGVYQPCHEKASNANNINWDNTYSTYEACKKACDIKNQLTPTNHESN